MATTTPYWQLEKEYYTIAESPDAVLRIIERTAVTTTENGFPLTIKSPSKLHGMLTSWKRPRLSLT